MQWLPVPSLVCYAFSAEVGLKALALFEGRTDLWGHDLKTLFLMLSPGLQAQLIADAGPADSFDTDLGLVRGVFDQWRYFYERGQVDTDLGFLQRFTTAIQQALARFPETEEVVGGER
jgi:hypothetical protein